MTVQTKAVIESLGLPTGRIQTGGKAKAVGIYLVAWDLNVPRSGEKDPKVRAAASTVRVFVWSHLKLLGCYLWQKSIWVIPNAEFLPTVKVLFENADKELRKVGLDTSRWQIVPVITAIEVQEAIGKSLAEGIIGELARYYDSFSEAMDMPTSKKDLKLANLRRVRRHLTSVKDLWDSESDEFKKIDPEIRKLAAERIDDLTIQLDAAIEDLAPEKKEK